MNYLDYYTPCELHHPEALRFGSQFIRPLFGPESLGMMLEDAAGSPGRPSYVNGLHTTIERLRAQIQELSSINDSLVKTAKRNAGEPNED